MTNKIYVGETEQLPEYLQFPRFLLGQNISTGAMLAYMLIYDRLRLSARSSSDWRDEAGHLYVFYPIEELAAHLHCSPGNVKKLLRELRAAGLLAAQRENGRANRICLFLPQPELQQKPPAIRSGKKTHTPRPAAEKASRSAALGELWHL